MFAVPVERPQALVHSGRGPEAVSERQGSGDRFNETLGHLVNTPHKPHKASAKSRDATLGAEKPEDMEAVGLRAAVVAQLAL